MDLLGLALEVSEHDSSTTHIINQSCIFYYYCCDKTDDKVLTVNIAILTLYLHEYVAVTCILFANVVFVFHAGLGVWLS